MVRETPRSAASARVDGTRAPGGRVPSEETGVSGFNLSRTVVPECFDDVAQMLVPILQERGVYKTAYSDGTLREKLFPGRGARLPAVHPAASFRRPPATSASDVRSDAAE